MRARENRTDLKEFLQSEVKNEICYCPNPGNAGDSAIATATHDLLDEAELEYSCVSWNESFDSSGKTVVYGGGGNLTENYKHARSFIQTHHQTAKQLILLPHTIKGHSDLLHQLGANVCLFCRERRSFEWAREHTDGPSVHLADDLAFRLNPKKMLGKESFAGAMASKEVGKTLTRSIASSILKQIGIDRGIYWFTLPVNEATRAGIEIFSSVAGKRTTLNALRKDAERTTETFPPSNVDVSALFEYGVAPPERARRATVGMLSFFSCYDRVVTNRLHGCVLAALLGKEVDFYANSYFKNEEVYRYSMEDRFPKVHWRGDWQSSLGNP